MDVYTDTARVRAGMEGDMFTGKFWKQAAERAVKAFAYSLLAQWGAGDVLGIGSVDWGRSFSVSGLAALLSVIGSVASAGVGEKDSPSLVSTK